MKKASAALWIVWIILIILIAGGLVYYFQYTKIPELNTKINDLQNQVNQLQEQAKQPADETADWKTYENTKYGYSVKYPSDWYLYNKGFYDAATKTYKDVALSVFISDSKIDDIPYGSDYPLSAFTITGGQDKFNFTEVKQQDASMTYTTQEISGESALKAVSKKASDFDQTFGTYYYINHDSKGYIVSWPNTDASGSHEANYDKILETFEFSD